MEQSSEINSTAGNQEKQPQYSPEQVSSYYLELERLLDRAENAYTHYQVFDLERVVSQGEIRLAYHKAIQLLYPASGIAANIPEETLVRIERVFEGVSKSFAVLANPKRRAGYDDLLRQESGKLQTPVLQSPPAPPPLKTPTPGAGRSEVSQPKEEQPRLHTEPPPPVKPPASNRRRMERMRLSLPVRVTGYDAETGRWQEVAETLDANRRGARIQLQTPVPPGLVLFLTMPLPVKLRNHGYTDSTYKVYAIVQRVYESEDGGRNIGVEFLGEHPPKGYFEKPWTIYQTKKWNGPERRKDPRASVTDAVVIEYFNESRELLVREMARAENLSRGGTRVCARMAPRQFAFVRVTYSTQGLEKFAAVSNRYRGKDGFERLCLRFVGDKWPTDGGR